jgi:general secretion pathway protein K
MKARQAVSRASQRGAALLVAMVLLTLVATLAAGMVWQQWRAVQVEIAERGRVQVAWILNGATDWARLFLREDARGDMQKGRPVDDLSEQWAQPLAEAKLSTFLSADQNNTADADAGPEAFLAGEIIDAQSRYNLRNVVANAQVQPAELEVLKRLCALLGLPGDVADRIASGLAAAEGNGADAPLRPVQLEDLAWLGVDAASIARLRDFTWLLPGMQAPAGALVAVNLNTAPREVIAAVLNVPPGTAERLVQSRQQKPLAALTDAAPLLPSTVVLGNTVSVNSQYFEIHGRMRLDDRMLEERSLVWRNGTNVVTLQRWREHRVLPPTGR